ncbi:MAG: hydroxymethylbilane synthase [Anaerolineales bacterium]
MRLTFATRPSNLARWQTGYVMQQLQAAWRDLTCEEEVIVTRGDRVLDKPLPQIGGKGLFTAELEEALRSGRLHAAVHSLKDLPTENPPGLVVGAIPRRADARDALVSKSGFTIESLPGGAVVGTSSLRRAAQILVRREDVQIESIRGNVETRLRKLMDGQYDAVVFAAAGLQRLGLDRELGGMMVLLPFEQMLPAPAQGALGIQCRADDAETLRLLAAIHDDATARAVTAERAFLAGLGGGCSVPVGAYGRLTTDDRPQTKDHRPLSTVHRLVLTGLVAAPDGGRIIRVQGTGGDPQELGQRLAEEALSQGAADLLTVDH